MPVDNGLGWSSYTPIKQRHFRAILNMHMRICKGQSERYGWKVYHYIDLNAGPGRYDCPEVQPTLWPEPINGSPLVFLQLAESLAMPYTAAFFEREECHAQSLRFNIARWVAQGNNIHLFNADHAAGLPTYIQDCEPIKQGLLYCDPTGNVPPFQLLAEISEQPKTRKLDFLIHCPATTVKRVRQFGHKTLTELLSQIHKKQWIVREPIEKHQWTFLLGTNWADFPEYRKQKFYALNSNEGQDILERLTHNKEELRAKDLQELGVPTLGLQFLF